MTTTKPAPHIDRRAVIDGYDPLAEVPAVEVRGDRLREGMILLDYDFGTPYAVLDHRMRAPRNSGCVQWAILDLDTGEHRETLLGANSFIRVMARG